MQEKSLNKIDEKLLNKIIAVAYKDAGMNNRIVVWMKSKKNPEVNSLLHEYRLTANSVHSFEEERLSEAILKRTYNKIGQKEKSSSTVPSIHQFIFSKPLISSAAIGLLIIAIASVLLFYNPRPEQKYTKAEIELAQQQFEQSLAIVGKVFHNTEKKLDVEVLSKHVSKPLNKGLIYLNDYLIGG